MEYSKKTTVNTDYWVRNRENKEKARAETKVQRAKDMAERAGIKELMRIEKINRKSEPLKYRQYRDKCSGYRNIEFNISVDVFNDIIKMNCIYCGDKGGGIDRVNYKLGYIVENCVPCCGRCNMMKFKYSVEEFINHVKKIASWQNQLQSEKTLATKEK